MTSVELKKLFPQKKVEARGSWHGRGLFVNTYFVFSHDVLLLYLFQISKVTETNLSANQDRKEMEKKRLVWKVEGSSREEQKFARGGPVDPAKLLVELAPMEIRTFVIEFSAATHHDIFDVWEWELLQEFLAHLEDNDQTRLRLRFSCIRSLLCISPEAPLWCNELWAQSLWPACVI